MRLNKTLDVLKEKDRTNDIALICDGVRVTFQMLNKYVDSAMLQLRENGLHNAQMVSVCMKRSIECVVVAIALLKSKIPFVLLPEDIPKERKKYIQGDSRSDYLIEFEKQKYRFTKLHSQLLFPFNKTAFLIYTSGSTGKPKGVSINRDSLDYFFCVAPDALRYRENSSVHLASTPFSFDLHVLDLFLPLYLGKTVILANDIETKNSRLMGNLLREYEVDTILATPTKILWLINGNKDTSFFSSLKTLVLAGENIRPSLLTKIRTMFDGLIYNAYGPTEATVFVTSKLIDGQNISAGFPLTGDEIFILDEALRQVNDGEEGEICISGPSLADGYVGNENQTVQKFPIIDGRRYYLTGDIGKLVDGELYILGRNDRQIKMNGYRIELDEIESVIFATDAVKDCAVSFDKVRNMIVAFYESREPISRDSWNHMLERYLPNYMIPKVFVHVPQIVRNSSGKIDRKFYDSHTEYFT